MSQPGQSVSPDLVPGHQTRIPAPESRQAVEGGTIDVTVLIEWENVLLAEDDRSVAMLRTLGSQISGSEARFEILVVFNPEHVDPPLVEQVVRAHLVFTGPHRDTPVRFEPIPGSHYYGMRNRGARMARGTVLLCLDSDVIPEDGWLEAVINPILTDPDIDVIGGTTYIEPDSLWARAFGAGWIFEPRNPDESLRSGNLHFWANNVAFRRSFFLASPYRENEQNGETRNADIRFRDSLRKHGTPVWIAGRARVSHPAPNGFRHFVIRGLGEGRDQSIMWTERGKGRLARTFRAIDLGFGRVRRTVRHAFGRRADLRLPVWEIPLVLAIMAAYAALIVAGAWIQTWLPKRCSMGWRF